MSSPLVIDTPAGIAAFRLLALRSALKMECKGLRMSRGIRASVLVRQELKAANLSTPRDLNALSDAFAIHLHAIGVLV